jgi:hypothetical protein
VAAAQDDHGRDRPGTGAQWRGDRDEGGVLAAVGGVRVIHPAQHLERHQHEQEPAGDRQRVDRHVDVVEHGAAEQSEADDQRPAAKTARSAVSLRCARLSGAVVAMEIGATPTGSMITVKVTKVVPTMFQSTRRTLWAGAEG